MRRIVLATANPHKVDELRAIFDRLGLADVELLTLQDSGVTTHEPHESGATFEENATLKALSYAAQTGQWCLADDSGLEVTALQGRPGVISSHYSTNGQETGLTRAQRDQANNARVLCELDGIPAHARSARFICVMVLATPKSVLHLSRGVFTGRIGVPPDVPRGTQGFGYDPLFLVAPDFTRTSSELSTDDKNLLSHRAHAAHAMGHWLREHKP